MTNAQPPNDAPKAEEIPLEDIDKILATEDPEFTQSLEEVRSVEADPNINIESTIVDENLNEEEKPDDKPETGFRKIKAKIRGAIFAVRVRLRTRLILLFKDLVVFLKTRPKEFALYSVALLGLLLKKVSVPVRAFKEADRSRKALALVLVAMVVVSIAILLANFKGIWLPQLTQPILHSLEEHADWVETFDSKEEGESFYSAFPQERHEFLFKKMKVNLRRTSENPNPMGAFEVIVLLDSKDTAIEVRDREVELHDFLQRVFEEESFNDLESELGKSKLKGRLKRELNQKLTQGWVKDVSFKTFVLKP